MPYILQTNHLTKEIKGKTLVSNIDLHVKKGEIYGFLGPNGAGKTTVMKMITNLWKPSSGTIELFGEALTPTSYEVLKRMGSIIEFPVFYEQLSGAENLTLHCEYMGYHCKDGVKKALELLSLGEAADKAVRSYSLGMKQRLGIARAILTKPELLVLDEPTNGLDPAGMKQIRDLFRMLAAEYGISIIISSHILSEIESIADTIGIIHHGRMQKEIPMRDISDMGMSYIELSTQDIKRASLILSDKLKLTNFKITDDRQIRIYDADVSSQEMSAALAQNGVRFDAIGRKAETLEDYFLKLTSEVNS